MRNMRIAATTFTSLLVVSAAAQAQLPFDATHCYAGAATVLSTSDEATVVRFQHKGIYRGNGDKKHLDGFSLQCAGTDVILSKTLRALFSDKTHRSRAFAAHYRADGEGILIMQVKGEESVKRAALKKLFSDPRFNVMDGLDVDIDDYSKDGTFEVKK